MASTPVSPLGSYRGGSSPLDRRGWTIALAFQEVLTAIVRLRYNRHPVTSAESFRSQILQALAAADQEARSRGYSPEDVNLAKFALVAFLDESALGCHNPAFADWNRQPVQHQLYGHLLAGEHFFNYLEKILCRGDSSEVADLLEVYYLCLLLGFKGRYAAGGDLRSVMAAVFEKIRRIRGPSAVLSPRGAIPAEAVRLSHSDPWLKRLMIASASLGGLAVILFAAFKFTLISSASELANLAAQFSR